MDKKLRPEAVRRGERVMTQNATASALADDLDRRLKAAEGRGWHPYATVAAKIASEAIAHLRSAQAQVPNVEAAERAFRSACGPKARLRAALTAALPLCAPAAAPTEGGAPPVPRCGKIVTITKEEAAAREAAGLHVEWAEGVGLHYFPAYDPPAPTETEDA